MHPTNETRTGETSAGETRPTSVASPTAPRDPAWLVTRVRRYGVVITVVVYLALLFAYLFPQDFRNESRVYLAVAWCVMIVGTFVFHIGLGMAVIAAAAWWCRLRRLAMATVPVLVFTLAPAAWQMVPRGDNATSGPTLRVMSANLLWNNGDTSGIVSEIVEAKADVLLLQEYTPHWHEAIQRAVGPVYAYCVFEDREDSFGAAIYSRFPFVGPVDSSVPLAGLDSQQIRAVVDVDGTHIAVYGVHLMPPRSLNRTGMNRAMFADLLDLFAEEQRPVIVGGDFNFTPTSSQAAELARVGFSEAHAQAGWGRGSTWPVHSIFRYVPGIRLDQVYVSDDLACVGSRTGVGSGSDHRPVIVDIRY